MRNIFITGTDTGVGKTYVAVGMLKYLKSKDICAIGLKPLASGSDLVGGKFVNQDASLLLENSSLDLAYETVNPLCFKESIAPHIAAVHAGVKLSVNALLLKTSSALQISTRVKIIEGVGGWDVPLNHSECMSDFVVEINPEIVMVVGMRLGCLNHAIQTYKSILHRHLPVSAWVANCNDPSMECIDENIDTLKQYLQAPFLGVLKYHDLPETVLDLERLF